MIYLIIYLLGIPLVAYGVIKAYQVPKEPTKIKTKYDDTVMASFLWPLIVSIILVAVAVILFILFYMVIHGVIMMSLNFRHVPQLFYRLFDKIEQTYIEEERVDEQID